MVLVFFIKEDACRFSLIEVIDLDLQHKRWLWSKGMEAMEKLKESWDAYLRVPLDASARQVSPLFGWAFDWVWWTASSHSALVVLDLRLCRMTGPLWITGTVPMFSLCGYRFIPVFTLKMWPQEPSRIVNLAIRIYPPYLSVWIFEYSLTTTVCWPIKCIIHCTIRKLGQ